MINENTLMESFEDFISKNYLEELANVVNFGHPSFQIDFCELDKYDPVLSDHLIENPTRIIELFKKAVKNIQIAEDSEFNIRFFNMPKDRFVRIRDIRSKHIGKLIAIDGLIRQASDVRPVATLAVFECPACGTQMDIAQTEQQMKEPSMCSCGRKGRFKLLSKKLVDTQRIVIEESTEQIGGEAQPRRIGVFLTEDLVEPKIEKKTSPGTKVSIIGILKEVPIIEKGGTKTTRFDLAIDSNNIETTQHEYEELDLTPDDITTIKKLAGDPTVFKKLSNSIAPSIFGYENIKEAIVLQLFGGVQSHRPDKTTVRGDIHILLVGDPGVAKSQMLKYVAGVSPKARYVSGKGTSGAGITATVVKDEFMRGWALEAGALVLANKGICCLHPETKVIANDQIKSIKSIFDEDTKYKARSAGEDIEICDIDVKVPTFQGFDVKNGYATKIRRKMYKGDMLELTFADGNSILLTPDHKIIDGDTLNWEKSQKFSVNKKAVSPLKIPAHEDGIRIKDLIPSEWKVESDVFIRKKTGERLKVDKVTPEMAYILGFIYGDGHVQITKKNSTIRIYQSTKKRKQIERLKEFWNTFSFKLLNEYIRNSTSRIRGKNVTSEVMMLYSGSNLFAQIYKSICGNNFENILKLPQEQLRAFISGLIDSDGCISVKHKKDYKTVSFEMLVSNKKEVCLNLITALKRFDVHARLRKRKNIMVVQSTGRQDIDNIVNETRRFSMKASEFQIPQKLRRISSESDFVSKEKASSLCEEISKLNKSMLLSKGVWSTIYNFKKMTGTPTRSSLKTIREKLKGLLSEEINSGILELEKRDTFLNDVVNVEKKKYEGYVYDLYVPKTNNFVAEGIIVHNCVDEIDKMEKEDRIAMHEAMEQQTITIAKANIHSTLRAETTILAAANPKLGRFDPYQPLGSQIDMPATLISRFDLIFTIRDLPDRKTDDKLASHILETFRKPQEIKPEIEPEIMKRYIAYAKQHCRPQISSEAISEIKDFFVNLRNKRSGELGDEGVRAISISARQLEAMVRLAYASAKIRLSETVTREDALRAINLMKYCLHQVGVDPETNELDIDRIVTGITSSERNRVITIRKLIKELEEMHGSNIALADLIDAAKGKGIEESKIEEIIEKMKRDGELYEPKQGIIRSMPK